MRSMTGYGRGTAEREGIRFVVEISTVNRKQCEVVLNMPRELAAIEPALRARVQREISRGRAVVSVTPELVTDLAAKEVRVDVPLARAFATALEQLRRDLGWLDSPLRLDGILRLPDVIAVRDPSLDPQAAWPVVDEALGLALGDLVAMRGTEGGALARDLARRLDLLVGLVEEIARRAPAMVEHYRNALRERIRTLGAEVEVDDERLAREVIYFADKSDITEELTRLRSHLAQMRELLPSDDGVGRTLEFLVQEVNREINTAGSKCADAEISRHVVAFKTELERIREQVQNIE